MQKQLDGLQAQMVASFAAFQDQFNTLQAQMDAISDNTAT
jgi:hypothetical protein